MLKDVEWAKDGTYIPGEEFSPERFFNDGLKNSCSFDLQLGYFSSATISVLAEGFATFIANGGVMRLIINQIVSEEDKNAIQKGVLGDVIDCVICLISIHSARHLMSIRISSSDVCHI